MSEDIQSVGSSSPSSTSLSPCDTHPIASKKRRKRTMISPTELEKLESLFKSEAWPSRVNKVRLAEEIRKTEHFVSTWFQNRRARQKREFRRSKNGSGNLNLPICNLQGDRSVGTVSINGDTPSGMNGTQQAYATPRIVAPNPIVYIRLPVTTTAPVTTTSNSSHVVKKQSSAHEKTQNDGLSVLSEASLSWNKVFQRTIGMIAAAEGLLNRDSSEYNMAANSALYGIMIKDKHRIYYDKIYGLDIENI